MLVNRASQSSHIAEISQTCTWKKASSIRVTQYDVIYIKVKNTLNNITLFNNRYTCGKNVKECWE